MDLLKQEQSNSPVGKDTNIDINGDQDAGEGAIKSMSAADSTLAVCLNKDELMKHAFEPFWVRLRNTLFFSFWVIWLSVLFGAFFYVFSTPGCRPVSASTLKAATNVTLDLDKKLS